MVTTRQRVDRVLLPQDESQSFLKDSNGFGARWKKVEAGWSVPLRSLSANMGRPRVQYHFIFHWGHLVGVQVGRWGQWCWYQDHGFSIASLPHPWLHARLAAGGTSSYCDLVCGNWHWPVGFLQPHHVLWRELAIVGCGSRDLVWWCWHHAVPKYLYYPRMAA